MTQRTEQLTPLQAAACLKAVLERRGATFALTADGCRRCDLNGADISEYAEADVLSTAVLALRDEIKQLLRDERTAH